MRLGFAVLMLVHGLIHLMGFIKGFHLATITQIVKPVSKPVGLVWLAAALLFFVAFTMMIIRKDLWWVIGLVAVVISQVLIFTYWTDAKFGSLANLVILVGALLAFGSWQFSVMVENEVNSLKPALPASSTLNEKSIQHLPEPVRHWLVGAGVIGKSQTYFAEIQQTGEMRSAPSGEWAPFSASHWVSFSDPSFVWHAHMRGGPGVHIAIRDKYKNGKGSMLVKIMSLITLNNAEGPEIDQGALQRYLAEMVWNPSFALNPKIQWTQKSLDKVDATLEDAGTKGTVTFTFDSTDMISKAEAQRYYYRGKNSSLEHWIVTMSDYKSLNGIRIPVKSEITWRLKEGDYTWFRMEIQSIKTGS